MTTPDITPPDVGDDAQDPKPDAVSFEIEHLRALHDPAVAAAPILAWVPIATIAVSDSYPTGYAALRVFADKELDHLEPGRYRVIDRRSRLVFFDEFDVRLVQHVEIDRVKDDSDSQVPA